MIKNDLKLQSFIKALAVAFVIGAVFSFTPAQATTIIDANIETDGWLKIGTVIPGSPVAGMIYYDSGTNKFRCYEGVPANWVDCIGSLSGTVPIASGGTGQTTKTAAFDALAPTTTIGDLIYNNGINNVRLAAGATNDILTISGGVPTWQASTPLVITNTYVKDFLDLNPGSDCTSIAGAQIGDVCIVTGVPNKSYICANATCTLGTDWKELLSSSGEYFAIANNFSELTLANKPTARDNLDLGVLDTPNFAGLDITPGALPGNIEGRIYYNNALKSLSYYNDHIAVDIGQKNILRVENTSGGAISYGQIVYISGAGTDGIPAVGLAKADSATTAKVLGFAAENIAAGSQGYVTAYGMLTGTGINTAGLTEGNPLYLSPGTAGAFTQDRPIQPHYEVPVGFVGLANNPGSIMAFVVPKLSTAIPLGGVPFGSTTADLISDGANLFWNNTTKRLGIGNNIPASTLSVGSSNQFQVNSTGNILKINNIAYSWPASQSSGTQFLQNDGAGNLTWTSPAGSGDITAVGSMILGDAFSDNNADDDWLGLGATAGRIEFDDQAIDEVNILNANVGIGTNTPGSTLDVKGTLYLSGATSGYVGLAPAAVAGSTTYTLPATVGSPNQVLTTDGTAGVLSWTSAGSSGSALSAITQATAGNIIANAAYQQNWNWTLGAATDIGLKFSETTASPVGAAGSAIVEVSALNGSNSIPLRVVNDGEEYSFRVDDVAVLGGDTTPFIIDKDGNVAIGATSFDPTNPEKLKVDAGTTSSINVIKGIGTVDSSLNLSMQNKSSGNNAMSVVAAVANNGGADSNTIAMGITSEGFNTVVNPLYSIAGPNDGFLVNLGNDLIVGTGMPGTNIQFITGAGFTTSGERMRIDGSGNVGIATTSPGSKLDVKGTLRLSGSNTGYVGLAPAADAGGTTYTLPAIAPTAGQVLSSTAPVAGVATLSWSSAAGVWQRVGTTLSPSISGDNVTSDGLLTASNGLTLTTGALNLTATSGLLSLAGLTSSSISTTGANNLVGSPVNINTTGTGSVNIGNGTGKVDLILGSDALGDIYYRDASGDLARLGIGNPSDLLQVVGGVPTWQTVTASEVDTLQTVYSRGQTINLNSGPLTISGANAVNITPTGALTLTGGAASTWSTSSGALTLTSAAGATWGTAAGDLTLRANSGVTNNVKIGNGGLGTDTPNLFAVDVKSTTGDPAGGYNGAMYYNLADAVFRCYEAGGWKNCGSSAASATTLQQAYTAGPTITTAGGQDVALVLTAGDFTASGAGSVDLTPDGPSSFTSGAALTLTAGATSTWSVTGAGNDLTIDAADVLNLGTINATAINLSKVGGAPITLANLNSAGIVHTNASGLLSTSAVGLASADVSGTLPVANGGTNITSYTIGDLIYASGATTLSKLADVATGSYLSSGGVGAAPAWSPLTSASVGLGNVTNDAQIPKSIGTAKGDLIAFTGASTPIKLPIGTEDDWVLMVDSSEPTLGMKWAANSPKELDFSNFKNGMALDASTSVAMTGFNLSFNNTGGNGAISMVPGGALTLTGGAASSLTTTTGALTLTSATAATWSTTAGNLTLQAGSGTVSLGTSTNLTATGALTLASGGTTALTIDSGGTGNLLIGTDANAETINIGTGAAAKTVTLGSTNSTSTTNIQSGTGDVNFTVGLTGASDQVVIGASGSATPDMLVLDRGTADPAHAASTDGAMYYNTTNKRFRCYQELEWKDCDVRADVLDLQGVYDNGTDAVIETTATRPITFTSNDGVNNIGLIINQNDTTFNPIALQINNAGNGVTLDLASASTGTGNDISAANWWVTKAGNIVTKGSVTTQLGGTITSDGLLTASNGLTMTTGALSLTSTSGVLSLAGLSASSVSTGANALTITSSNFNTTATGINSTNIGATTAGTGAFTTLSSTGVTTLGNDSATVAINSSDWDISTIGEMTNIDSLSNTGALTITAGAASTWSTSTGALTLTSAGATTWSTAAGNLNIDSAAALNLGTTNATSLVLGKAGVTTTNIGALQIGQDGNDGSLVIYSEQGVTDYNVTFNPHATMTQSTAYILPAAYPAASGYALTSDTSGNLSWTNISGGSGGWSDDGTVVRLTTATDQVGIGTATPSANTLLHLYRNDTQTVPGLLLEQASTGDTALRYLRGTSTLSVGLDQNDNDNYKIGNAAALTGTTYTDANTLFRLHTEAGSEGIIDFNHQSRARAYRATTAQSIASASWTQVQFNAETFDEKNEFNTGTYQFTALEEGYYQVNSRIKFTIAGNPGTNTYISMAIYRSGALYSYGNNLAISGSANDDIPSSNATNISDIIYLTAGQTITIYVYQDSGVAQNVDINSENTYVSIHKVS